MARIKTCNRGWLRRRVQAGVVEAKCDFRFSDDYAYDNAIKFGKTDWLPARFSTGYGDFIEGQMNLHSDDFTCKCGRAWWNEDSTITLYKGYESYTLRIREDE